MRLEELIKDYLQEAIIMQLATVKNNKPWACTVHFVFDDTFNLYWISRPTRRHSMELKFNKNVAGVVVLPHKVGQEVRGLQFEGTASVVTNKEVAENAMKLYVKRFKMSEKRAKDIVGGKDNHTLYKVEPSSIILFDVVNFPDNPRRELKLK